MLWLDFLNGCINLDLKIWIFFKNFPLPSIHHSRNLRNSIKRIALDWLTTPGWFNFKRKIYMKSFLGAIACTLVQKGKNSFAFKKKNTCTLHETFIHSTGVHLILNSCQFWNFKRSFAKPESEWMFLFLDGSSELFWSRFFCCLLSSL